MRVKRNSLERLGPFRAGPPRGSRTVLLWPRSPEVVRLGRRHLGEIAGRCHTELN